MVSLIGFHLTRQASGCWSGNALPLRICYWRVRYVRVTLPRKRMSTWI